MRTYATVATSEVSLFRNVYVIQSKQSKCCKNVSFEVPLNLCRLFERRDLDEYMLRLKRATGMLIKLIKKQNHGNVLEWKTFQGSINKFSKILKRH